MWFVCIQEYVILILIRSPVILTIFLVFLTFPWQMLVSLYTVPWNNTLLLAQHRLHINILSHFVQYLCWSVWSVYIKHTLYWVNPFLPSIKYNWCSWYRGLNAWATNFLHGYILWQIVYNNTKTTAKCNSSHSHLHNNILTVW